MRSEAGAENILRREQDVVVHKGSLYASLVFFANLQQASCATNAHLAPHSRIHELESRRLHAGTGVMQRVVRAQRYPRNSSSSEEPLWVG